MDREGIVSLSDVFSARDISILVVEWEMSGLSHLLAGDAYSGRLGIAAAAAEAAASLSASRIQLTTLSGLTDWQTD